MSLLNSQNDLVRQFLKACEVDDLDTVQQLIKIQHAPTADSRSNDWLPLHTALYNRAVRVADYLLSQPNVDVNQTTRNQQKTSPLHLAAWRCPDYPKILERLIDAGAQINRRDGYGQTALHDAAYHGNTRCVEVLLRRGIDASARNLRGYTAAQRAKANRHLKCAEMIQGFM
ncbi:ankyrin repeat-containing domain protein [Jimgerdemannia flammicorona]|uniref:Ankyrin repeat-containing domain protein n=1 Tax=Jimgerdemannia flammicorona TaxID=994334 RepID=A0A433QE92_9FUNG|nr:ankyrin repeat-containing domain protein [Jimgerdemannia flammicorona]